MLKKIVYNFIKLLNLSYMFFLIKKNALHNSFIFTRLKNIKNNEFIPKKTKFSRVKLYFAGEKNKVNIEESEVVNSTFSIKGNNNTIIINRGTVIRNCVINLRGENCSIIIDEFTTFGGARLVNVGKNNQLYIGKRCLFSDNIEIWASDTHSIYDEHGEQINKEKPIYIGNDVWIGAHVTILKGVIIGEGSIIGMRSVVVNDVPAKSISVGSPNKVVKNDICWSLKYE